QTRSPNGSLRKPPPRRRALKPAAAPTPAGKQSPDSKPKDHSPKNQAAVAREHRDSKPRDVASPHPAAQQQLRKEPQPSGLSPPANPPPVLPKPAARKETHAPGGGGAASGKFSACESKAAKDGPRSEALRADGHRAAESRAGASDKHAPVGRKEAAERKRKDAAQEAASAQKNAKRDASRASPSADKDAGRCKQQKESPRSSGNKK
ncbi:ensconsin-like, partial [Brachyistius frenatus]|uniref:ensconsin-like n=1 Tax=Brachyistius frenatus TaxID=100188 RepID=UPI0037E7F00E